MDLTSSGHGAAVRQDAEVGAAPVPIDLPGPALPTQSRPHLCAAQQRRDRTLKVPAGRYECTSTTLNNNTVVAGTLFSEHKSLCAQRTKTFEVQLPASVTIAAGCAVFVSNTTQLCQSRFYDQLAKDGCMRKRKDPSSWQQVTANDNKTVVAGRELLRALVIGGLSADAKCTGKFPAEFALVSSKRTDDPALKDMLARLRGKGHAFHDWLAFKVWACAGWRLTLCPMGINWLLTVRVVVQSPDEAQSSGCNVLADAEWAVMYYCSHSQPEEVEDGKPKHHCKAETP